MSLRYLPHIFYATALTSFSMHLLNHRKNAAEERAQFHARESVLTSIIRRLQAGENVTDGEIARLRMLGEKKEFRGMLKDALESHSKLKATSWRDAILGQRGADIDEEQFLKEWEAYVKANESTENSKKT